MPLLILEKYGEEALLSHTKVYHVGTYFVAGDLIDYSGTELQYVFTQGCRSFLAQEPSSFTFPSGKGNFSV